MVHISNKASFPPEQIPETVCGCGKISFIYKNAICLSMILATANPCRELAVCQELCQMLCLLQLLNSCRKLWREMLLCFPSYIWRNWGLEKSSNWLKVVVLELGMKPSWFDPGAVISVTALLPRRGLLLTWTWRATGPRRGVAAYL